MRRCSRMRTHKRLCTRQFHVHGVTVPDTHNIDANGQPYDYCHQECLYMMRTHDTEYTSLSMICQVHFVTACP
jgi:hypothetical protein